MQFVSPKNDIAFKKIFGNEAHLDILISFLNAVLNLDGDKAIQSVTLLNTAQLPESEILKLTHLDIEARDGRGITFIIEMQVEPVKGYQKRFVYYASKAFVQQIHRGEDYPRLNQVLFIGILDFDAFEGDDYITRHLILNTRTNKQELDAMEFTFIELPKFTKTETEVATVLEKWVYFLKHVEQMNHIPAHSSEPPLRTAYDIAYRYGWTPEELQLYDRWGMHIQDEIGKFQYVEERGRMQGREEGQQAAQYAIVQNMLAQGSTPEEVSKLTGIPLDVVMALS